MVTGESQHGGRLLFGQTAAEVTGLNALVQHDVVQLLPSVHCEHTV